MVIVNYITRILIIIIGILFLSGVLFPDHPMSDMYRVMGVIFILWGVYRILIYRVRLRELKKEQEEEE